jgi:hypothetical protein
MKRILLGIDSLKLEMDALDFACYLANLTKSNLTGVFLENIDHEERNLRDLVPLYFQEPSLRVAGFPKAELKDGICEQNIKLFCDGCEKRGVLPFIHRDRGIPLSEMIMESRFADLIVIDAETSFSGKFEGIPTGFVKDILAQAECPVIIAPQSFDGINEIFFAYDGTESSSYAIRQFTYLLPEFKNTKVNVVHVTKEQNEKVAKKHQLHEWLKVHYSDIHFTVLHGAAGDRLFEYLVPKKNSLAVLGCFGRSGVSRFMRPSRGELIAKAVNLPLFITHF